MAEGHEQQLTPEQERANLLKVRVSQLLSGLLTDQKDLEAALRDLASMDGASEFIKLAAEQLRVRELEAQQAASAHEHELEVEDLVSHGQEAQEAQEATEASEEEKDADHLIDELMSGVRKAMEVVQSDHEAYVPILESVSKVANAIFDFESSPDVKSSTDVDKSGIQISREGLFSSAANLESVYHAKPEFHERMLSDDLHEELRKDPEFASHCTALVKARAEFHEAKREYMRAVAPDAHIQLDEISKGKAEQELKVLQSRIGEMAEGSVDLVLLQMEIQELREEIEHGQFASEKIGARAAKFHQAFDNHPVAQMIKTFGQSAGVEAPVVNVARPTFHAPSSCAAHARSTAPGHGHAH